MTPPTSFALATASPGLLSLANRVLYAADPADKVRLTREAVAAWRSGASLGAAAAAPARPARPLLPKIVPSTSIPRARELGVSKNVYLLHALAHVELNAIDLSVDTLVRYAPERERAFAGDMLSMPRTKRATLSNWSADCAHLEARQLVQEARGLDAGPRLAARLVGAGDNESAQLVRTIADEELRHVQIGVKWFITECERLGKEPVLEFHAIAMRYANPGAFAPPFDEQRRGAAGLTPEWYLPVAEQMRVQMQEIRDKRGREKRGRRLGWRPRRRRKFCRFAASRLPVI
eukprot:IDg16259t1